MNQLPPPGRAPPAPIAAASMGAFILAIGISGDIDALPDLIRALPLGKDLAVVILRQDSLALSEQAVRTMLAEHACIPLIPRDGDPLEGGQVYLLPPKSVGTLEEGRFRLGPADPGGNEGGIIDSFFQSVAQDQDGNTIGLMLGDGSGDGVMGLAAIREAGGLALAVEPAEQDGALQDSRRPAALADHVLAVHDLGRCVEHYMRYHAAMARQPDADALLVNAEELAQVALALRNHTGHDFHGYKRGTFLRRVQRRMQVQQVASLRAYVERLRAEPEEAQQLFNDLLIGVTEFFRDQREFAFMETQIIPRLFDGKSRGDAVRVWVLGCSTGEEAYSLAMLLREHAATLDAPPLIQIFASDIDGRGLAVARVGRYPSAIADRVSAERLERWFVREANTYLVSRELREICVFSQHSLVKDPPFSRLDLVSCRNLLIYLDADLQNRVVPMFHFALRRGGYLFLGTSENVSRHARLFSPVERGFRVFRKLETGSRVHSDFPLTAGVVRTPAVPVATRNPATSHKLTRLGERIAERYAPAFAVIDEHYDVVHFSAQVGRFIHPSGGAPSLNLLNLVHRDLRLDMRAALDRAAAENRMVSLEELAIIDSDGSRASVDLIVEPAVDTASSTRGFVVFFKDSAQLPDSSASAVALASRDDHERGLENELRITRQRLQAMIEELESTNEELKSSNEEYQSLNEELQSANEELETSKEELQSVNEEVTTVNGELAHRVQELAHSNSDLKNLLESTQIATVFLDNELRVTNFTPAVTEIFPLVEADIHRPIGHITCRLSYDELQHDARQVLRTLAVVDREVDNPQTGAKYMVRVLPYRSVDNFIGGVVVTFTDVTRLTEAERANREGQRRLLTLIEGIPQLVWRSLGGGQWTWSSPQWTAYTGQSATESCGLGWLEAVHPDDREQTMAAWRDAPEAGGLRVEHRIFDASQGLYRWFHSRSAPVLGDDGRVIEWLGTSTEVDRLHRLQEEQRVLVAELQHRTRNLISVVHSIARQTIAGADSLEGFREQFEDRLQALSRVQSLLSQSDAAPALLDAVLRMELDALGFDDDARVRLQGPAVPLRKSAVQVLALAVHELATNARKYGGLSVPDGRLEVSWRAQEGTVVLDWIEHGRAAHDGQASDAIRGGGYGRKLIEQALPYALDAKTRYALNDRGLHCTVELPTKEPTS